MASNDGVSASTPPSVPDAGSSVVGADTLAHPCSETPVVGTQPAGATPAVCEGESDPRRFPPEWLDHEDELALLNLARQAVMEAVCNGKLPGTLRDDGVFGRRCGVFVTLHIAHSLRGCIGVVETPVDTNEWVPHPRFVADSAAPGQKGQPRRGQEGVPTANIEPLGHSIVRCAATAALCDPRFPPLRPGELSALQIEISLLSSPFPILPEEIVLGRHGIIVRASAVAPPHLRVHLSAGAAARAGASYSASTEELQPRHSGIAREFRLGVLLPQVAVEHNFTLEEFLAEAYRKASLPAGARRRTQTVGDPCLIELLAFTSHVFSDETFRLPDDSA